MDPKDLVPIPIAEFVSGSSIPVDLYVQLSPDKFVLVAKAGSKTEISRLRNYEQKDMKHFFVKKEDYETYVNQNITIAGVLISKQQLSNKQKTTLLTRSANAVFKEFESLGLSQKTFEHAKKISNAMVQLVNSQSDFEKLIKALGEMPGDMVSHGVAVSILSTMIAKTIGWKKPDTIEKLALGGLLHDIGKKELPPELLSKPRAEMSFDEVVLYESHPFRGMQLLQSLSVISEDVIAMAYEHHENAIGQGYPRRLRDMRMNPLARVTALANCFVDLTISNPNQQKPRTALDAIQHIENTMGRPYNREIFNALKQIIEEGSMKKKCS